MACVVVRGVNHEEREKVDCQFFFHWITPFNVLNPTLNFVNQNAHSMLFISVLSKFSLLLSSLGLDLIDSMMNQASLHESVVEEDHFSLRSRLGIVC